MLSPYVTLHCPYILPLYITSFSVPVCSWFEGSDIASRQSLRNQFHIEIVNVILDFCFVSSNSHQINSIRLIFTLVASMLFSQTNNVLPIITFLWCHRSGQVHIMISENEDVREACLTPERNRHTCLRQTLLARKRKTFCLMFNLCSTGHADCPLPPASGGSLGAGGGPGDCSGRTSRSLPRLAACVKQTQTTTQALSLQHRLMIRLIMQFFKPSCTLSV